MYACINEEVGLPVVEVSLQVADRLFGQHVEQLLDRCALVEPVVADKGTIAVAATMFAGHAVTLIAREHTHILGLVVVVSNMVR